MWPQNGADGNSQFMSDPKNIMEKYWPDPVSDSENRRHAFMLELVTSRVASGATIVDVGGGWGAFAALVASCRYSSVLIDDFRDEGFFDRTDRRFAMQNDFHIQVISRDVLSDGIDFSSGSVDCFTCFDSIEHWHGSPKTVLHQMRAALRPGGYIIISVPNAVNLRKRISMFLGRLDWTSMYDWYEQKVFRSHVREPRLQDLLYIANDLKMEVDFLTGRNWIIYDSRRLKAVAPIVDHVLRLRPTLCSDLYAVLRKPTQ